MGIFSKWSIEDISRGYVTYKEDKHIAYVPGEMLVGGYQQPDYVIYAGTPFKWEPPFSNESIEPSKQEEVIKRVCDELKTKGLKVEVDW